MRSGVVEPNADLTSNLKELRGDKSVTQVALEVGMSRKAIYDLESGLSAPDCNTLKALIAYYGSPITFELVRIVSDKSK